MAAATLRIGTTDHTSTLALQRALAAAGFTPGACDGLYGLRTAAAVAGYQRAHPPLDVDGVAGPATLAALGLAGAPSDGPPTQPTGADTHALPSPPPGWIMGVDLSDAQGVVDGRAIAAAGCSFAYVKASDGRHDGQRYARASALSLDGAGIHVGFYGVLEPYGPASVEEQVANFLRRREEIGVPSLLPPWCDFELAAGLSGIAALKSAALWCEQVEEATGLRPMIYTGPAFVGLLARYAGAAGLPILTRLRRFPLAVAHYGRSLAQGPSVPAPWQDWTVWQYSGDPAMEGQRERAWHHLPGGRTPVDVDWYRGTVEELIAEAEPP